MFESIDHSAKSDKNSLPDQEEKKNINLLPENLRLEEIDKLKIKQLKKDVAFSYPKDKKYKQPLLTKLVNAFKSKFARPVKSPVILPAKKIIHPGAAKKHITDIPNNKEQTIAMANLKDQKAGSTKIEAEFDVNLLPRREHILTDKQMIFSYLLIIIIGFLAVISPYVFYHTKASQYQKDIALLAEQNRQIKEQAQDLQNKMKDYSGLSTKLNKLLALFNQHIYWSQFFPTLEKHTVANLYFTSLDADDEYHINLQATALTLRAIAEQLVVFKNNADYGQVELKNININKKDEASNETSSVEAAFSFELNENVIY